MKRALVDYATSSDDDDGDEDGTQSEVSTQQSAEQVATVERPPIAKKRRAEAHNLIEKFICD